MPDLNFTDLARAAYTANRLLTFITRLEHYAKQPPADLDQARDMLGAIAEVCKNSRIETEDTYDQIMVGNIPAECFENEASSPGFLFPLDAEESIRRWRLRQASGER